LYKELDEGYYINVNNTKDKKYAIVMMSSKKDTEIRVIDKKLGAPTSNDLKLLFSRKA